MGTLHAACYDVIRGEARHRVSVTFFPRYALGADVHPDLTLQSSAMGLQTLPVFCKRERNAETIGAGSKKKKLFVQRFLRILHIPLIKTRLYFKLLYLIFMYGFIKIIHDRLFFF